MKNPAFAPSGLRRFLRRPRLARWANDLRPLAALGICILLGISQGAAAEGPALELSRPARTWEFLPVVGMNAALLGNESGQMEAWVYPLKIFRNFHLTFHAEGRALPAETLVRTLVVRPESATLVYASDNYAVRETLFVPVHEAGAVIEFEVETTEPLEIEAHFTGDFALEWPAAVGGTFSYWDETHHAIVFGEESKKFAALVGSPTAADAHLAYQTNYSASEDNSFRLGVTAKGRASKTIVVAGSTQGFADALAKYQRLRDSYSELLRESAQYYRDYLARTVSLTLPDARLQQAYDWSRVSTVQGLVTNATLGTGLVAGYRTSGTSQRPGFAWFFGRDSFWSTLALNASGDFATARTAIDFVSRFQRADGKIPHEISQGASFVDWFKDYPYGFSSADATPLYIIATNDYVAQSGDVEFAKQKWESLWKAYQFLRSTYDGQQLPQNFGIGHGWIEGGPLLPVKTEFYQSGLGLEALRALANLAKAAGKDDAARELEAAFERQRPAFNEAFWSAERKAFVYALNQQNQKLDEVSVLETAPMWFGVTDAEKSEATIQRIADADHSADWGTRIISNRSPVYNGQGYHFGSVWPLFTGWASVGAYRYHQEFPAYANLRANALLALDGSLGHVAEVLSGDYYQPLSTNSPHQIWSAAMVVSPMLRGMLGLEIDAAARTATFAPHIPAGWTSTAAENVRVNGVALGLRYQRTPGAITLDVTRTGDGDATLRFSPAISLRTQVASAEWNGHAVAFHVEDNANDRHVTLSVPVRQASGTVRIRLKNDFGVSYANELPALANASEGLRVLSQRWNAARTELTLEVSGRVGKSYALTVWNPAEVASVEGATMGPSALTVAFPAGGEEYVHRDVVIRFRGK